MLVKHYACGTDECGSRSIRFTCDMDTCCGCGACAAICPASCITMVPDLAGFLYPDVDERGCYSCGRCTCVCPLFSNSRRYLEVDSNASAYWAISYSDSLLEKSSSGGVFGLLAQSVLAEGGLVCGAVFDSGYKKIQHECIEDVRDLKRLQGSKYVQSSIHSETYRMIKRALNKGQKVLFSGTGCQVKGLRGYLGHLSDSDYLLCVEVICHGVPSPFLWEKYVELHSAMFNNAQSFSFRGKSTGWETYSMEWRLGAEIATRPHKNDWYMQAFLSNISLRRSCFSCPAKTASESDLTLGDFWGFKRVHPEVDSKKGVSAVIVRSRKGSEAFAGIKDKVIHGAVSVEDIAKENPSLLTSSKPHRRYGEFLSDLASNISMSELIAKWNFNGSFCGRILRKAKRIFLKERA